MDVFYPVQLLADTVTGNWLNLGKESCLDSALNFFIYDTIKIGILLVFINYLMAVSTIIFLPRRFVIYWLKDVGMEMSMIIDKFIKKG